MLRLLLPVLLVVYGSEAFLPISRKYAVARPALSKETSTTILQMGMDMVTYLRTEWVSAALFTNQTPRAADVCLQLGTEDGRCVTFIPKTIRELITSSADPDGKLTVSARRQLKQQQERRGAATVKYVDQPADDLRETQDESVDVVVSMNAAARMKENGLDWKKGIREAARVLKPGGRLLFVEQSTIDGESYLEYVQTLADDGSSLPLNDEESEDDEEEERFPMFDDVGFDEVDLVLVPQIAGVAIKSEDAGLSAEQRARKEADQEKNRMADLSLEAFERGNKRKRRKKKKAKTSEPVEESS